MPTLFAIASLLLIAAITPGPNNIVMIRVGARHGVRGALPAMTGVLLGGMALLVLIVAGAGVLFTRWPMLRLGVAIVGALYLLWLGLHLLRGSGKGGEVALPVGIIGLFVFQFLNPKSWVMLLTVVAVLPPGSELHAFARIAPLFVGISAGCLLLWAATGHFLALVMAKPATQRRIDRVLGVCLIASTLLLFH